MRDIAPIFHELIGADIAWEISNIDDFWNVLAGGALAVPNFEWRKYARPSQTWDHDHCVGCYAKYMDEPHEGVLLEGWGSIAPNPNSQKAPDQIAHFNDGSYMVGPPSNTFDWLCNECHIILKGLLDGSIKPTVLETAKPAP